MQPLKDLSLRRSNLQSTVASKKRMRWIVREGTERDPETENEAEEILAILV